MVSCIASGSNVQMLEKEAELQRNGFREVPGPEIGPTEYCRILYRNGSAPGFHLFWMEDNKTNTLEVPDSRTA